MSVYECGFDPFDDPGNPFSVRCFLIGISVLIFDLELSFLFPWAVTYRGLPLFVYWVARCFFFILILVLVCDWIVGCLVWEN